MKKEQKLIFRLLPLLIAAVIAALLPQMIRNEYYMTIACQILIYLIAVCGLNFITGLTGQMNLGNAAVFGLGAYTAALTTTKLGISPWVAMLLVIVMGWLIVLVLRPAIEALTLRGFMWLLAGGVSYTVGAVLYGVGKKKRYIHGVFHIFVDIASVLQAVCAALCALNEK